MIRQPPRDGFAGIPLGIEFQKDPLVPTPGRQRLSNGCRYQLFTM